MLAIVSDLHLQETTFDCIRYRDGGTVRQIGVRRNVKASAFDQLVARIREAARRRKSAEIHLVLAGDIFELHRAPHWFFGPDCGVRPTDPVGADVAENPLRRKVVEILRQLTEDADHREVWKAIREFGRRRRGRPRVTLHYLPGNHDRLVNAWPSVRQQVRRLLGMNGATDPFPVCLDFVGPAPADYGVRVRHGHEYDPPNFAASTATTTVLSEDWQDYLAPAFGDYITVDVAMRLAMAFRAHYAQALRGGADPRTKLPPASELRRLYLALTEFDDVRPASLLTDYLAIQMGPERKQTFRTLKPVLRDVIETAVANRFFVAHASRHVPKALLTLLPTLVKNLSPNLIEEVVRRLSKSGGDEEDTPARRALGEFAPDRRFNVLVAGHTHRPEHVPLAGASVPPEAIYLNSGTWRTTLPFGLNGFGRLRAYTMVFAYNAAERAVGPEDGRTFETWTGHLAAGTLGPYDEVVQIHSPAPPGAMQLLFESLEVLAVQHELKGAELRVNLGVDDQGCQIDCKQVKPGSRHPLPLPPLSLDPDLDGDLWFNGVEVDLGGSPLDYDDPLPWALEPLPREAARGQFRPGTYTLRILGRGVGGADHTEFLLHYRIAPR